MFCGEPGCRQWAKTLEHGRSKELTDYLRRKKKKWKTASLDRNIRSRKWKAYRFSIHDISGGKADSLWPRTGHLPAKLPFSPFLPALHCFLVDVMLRTTSVSWEWRQGHLQSSFICSYCTHRQKNPERLTFWKREIQEQWVPAWSSFLEVFFSQKKLWGFSFLSARALPSHRCPQTLLQHRVSGLHRPARLIPCRANINASPNGKRLKTGTILTHVPGRPRT